MKNSRTNYVLVDYENSPVASLERLMEERFVVMLFLGKTNTKLPREIVAAMLEKGKGKAMLEELDESRPNALDFLVAYRLGQISLQDPEGFFHVISKDKGFDPLIRYLKDKNIFAARSESIEDMPCFRTAAGPKENQATTATKASQPSIDLAVGFQVQAAIKLLLDLALEDLRARHSKGKAPKTRKGLINTIHSKIGQDKANEIAVQVFDSFVEKRLISLKGEKVNYALGKRPMKSVTGAK